MPPISSSGPEDHLHHQGRKQSRDAHRARRSGYAQGARSSGFSSRPYHTLGNRPSSFVMEKSYKPEETALVRGLSRGPQPEVLKHFRKRRRTWAVSCGRRAHDLTHVSTERANESIHLPSPSINTPRFVLLRSFIHYCTLSHTAYIPLILLSCTTDLSIGGASPDTSPAPFDKCSLVAGIRTHSPIPDARRSRGPRRGNSSSAELFGYIKFYLRFFLSLIRKKSIGPAHNKSYVLCKKYRSSGTESTQCIKLKSPKTIHFKFSPKYVSKSPLYDQQINKIIRIFEQLSYPIILLEIKT
ncbi:hypothetical protein F511_20679 [Dorcoceras hygrometricum]|uniref:Uncharacterized protein n=1 Tax=Dorcoceras hygrometricum TaxID=472368 RepID=A0A2Z7B878_9LAMI|nr:hypothetical protein F511_20679 [Dorcoceras hygrometricum]